MKDMHSLMSQCAKVEKAACGWEFANIARFSTCLHRSRISAQMGNNEIMR